MRTEIYSHFDELTKHETVKAHKPLNLQVDFFHKVGVYAEHYLLLVSSINAQQLKNDISKCKGMLSYATCKMFKFSHFRLRIMAESKREAPLFPVAVENYSFCSWCILSALFLFANLQTDSLPNRRANLSGREELHCLHKQLILFRNWT